MQKKLTLNETWKYCLAMWKWIAEEKGRGRCMRVNGLKKEWVKEHLRPDRILENCFFCEYDTQHRGWYCSQCPGKLVSKRFDCGNTSYNYCHNPINFYQKLVELNEKRKSK